MIDFLECHPHEHPKSDCSYEAECGGDFFQPSKLPNGKCCRCKHHYKRHEGFCIPEKKCPLSKLIL